VLGLYALAGAAFVVAAHIVGWYGDATSPWVLAPFVALLGGVQFLAGMWAFAARDGLATAMLGIWGSFWVAYGILSALFATGRLTEPTGAFEDLAFWFVVLAAITWMGAIAATAENMALVAVLGFLAAGSTFAAIGESLGSHGFSVLAGSLFLAAAVCGWYTATAMMLEGTFRREVLPIGYASKTATPSTASSAGSGALRQAPPAHRPV
jgi:succinate-acetate transporter protein